MGPNSFWGRGSNLMLECNFWVISLIMMHCLGRFHIISPEMPKLSQHWCIPTPETPKLRRYLENQNIHTLIPSQEVLLCLRYISIHHLFLWVKKYCAKRTKHVRCVRHFNILVETVEFVGWDFGKCCVILLMETNPWHQLMEKSLHQKSGVHSPV